MSITSSSILRRPKRTECKVDMIDGYMLVSVYRLRMNTDKLPKLTQIVTAKTSIRICIIETTDKHG